MQKVEPLAQPKACILFKTVNGLLNRSDQLGRTLVRITSKFVSG